VQHHATGDKKNRRGHQRGTHRVAWMRVLIQECSDGARDSGNIAEYCHGKDDSLDEGSFQQIASLRENGKLNTHRVPASNLRLPAMVPARALQFE